jgi:hypothetical protein
MTAVFCLSTQWEKERAIIKEDDTRVCSHKVF